MTISKKDYLKLAKILQDSYRVQILMIADELRHDNPQFDFDRFCVAAGIRRYGDNDE